MTIICAGFPFVCGQIEFPSIMCTRLISYRLFIDQSMSGHVTVVANKSINNRLTDNNLIKQLINSKRSIGYEVDELHKSIPKSSINVKRSTNY